MSRLPRPGSQENCCPCQKLYTKHAGELSQLDLNSHRYTSHRQLLTLCPGRAGLHQGADCPGCQCQVRLGESEHLVNSKLI